MLNTIASWFRGWSMSLWIRARRAPLNVSSTGRLSRSCKTFSPACFRRVVAITGLSSFSAVSSVSPMVSPPRQARDLLQEFRKTNYKYDFKYRYTCQPKSDCHNLINKSVNRTPPTISAIQLRLLALKEGHCVHALELATPIFHKNKYYQPIFRRENGGLRPVPTFPWVGSCL